MSDIQTLLGLIKTAIYGRDVRQAIHDAIRKCYDDGRAGATDLTARELATLNAEQLRSEISTFESSAETRMDTFEAAAMSQITAAIAGFNTQMNNFLAACGTVNGTLISETVLYEGQSVSGPTATIDITQEQLAEYDYIDIHYKTAGTYRRIERVTPGILAHTTNLNPILYTNGEKSMIVLETKVQPDQSGAKISMWTNRWAWNGAASAAATLREETNVGAGITKIVGIKHITVQAAKDGELSDLRIAPDGTTYATAGAMIRGQLEAITERLDELGLYRDASGDLCEEDE